MTLGGREVAGAGPAGGARRAPRRRPGRLSRGYTMFETVFTVVILVIMMAMGLMKLATPATLTLPGQVKAAAEQVRRAQTMASARKQRMGVTVTAGKNGALTIACATSPPACPTDASLVLKVDQGVVVGSPSAAIYFNSLGQPVDSTGAPNAADVTMTFVFGPETHTVTVAALTGRVTVAP